MEENIHNCPVCNVELRYFPRYPNYICKTCAAKATDINGRKLRFMNTDLSGGFRAEYCDTDEVYDSRICYVDGIVCYADEARFGGIVIEKK
jgi:hypothetical protein